MNAVEIEEAISTLAEAPFDAATFPYDFLQAFGLNDAGIRKLKSGDTNKSDLRDGPWRGGVLQRNKNNIHLLTCPPGEVAAAMDALRASPATAKHKARFILATDGQTIQAERFDDGEPLACDFKQLPDRFTFFLSLAGISTVKRIDENAFDIRATGRLNKLYVELLKENPAWDTDARRQDLNHFFARLIFCFFAEDTNIFQGHQLFTSTVELLTERDGSNTHEVLARLFEAMNTPREARAAADHLPASALKFPYVNGNLFGGSTETPKFNQSARNYLLFVGKLDWKKINPDIFGSMIQAVADDEERGALGMHYTSVPNILKVLNPLFLDDLKAKLAEAGDGKTPGSARKLLNLRNRLARIRVFDPACGSGNFLVIAYKEMRQIEAIINERRGEMHIRSAIPISNFRGIELRSFPAEIARLALVIAQFQSDVVYRGQLIAEKEFLPLNKDNWIVCGNALRLDWLAVCPPTGTGVRIESDGLFKEKLDQIEIDFKNTGGETYICGNPPYVGDKKQNKAQKSDVEHVLGSATSCWRSLDYICGFIYKACQFLLVEKGVCGFVSTNSVVQGQHVPRFWALLLDRIEFSFAVNSFKWSNLATNKAGVTCVVIGINSKSERRSKYLFDGDNVRQVENISPYLTARASVIVMPANSSVCGLPKMTLGNVPKDDGGLLLSIQELTNLALDESQRDRLIKNAVGSTEFIQGKPRYCLWISDDDLNEASRNIEIRRRIEHVRSFRKASVDPGMAVMANRPHQFREMNVPKQTAIVVPRVSSEYREYLPTGIFDSRTIITDRNYAIYDGPIWAISLVASRLHCVWIGTVCVRMRTDFSYSNTLGWNTFPIPTLTDQNKADLTRCAEDILLAREAHFPATIADLYDPEAMDTKYPDLRAAHDRNDETLERIYIGRRFRNDTERLEKLFELYTEMTGKQAAPKPAGRKKKG